MLGWATLSLTLAVASALLGFGNADLAAAEVWQVLSVVFLVLFIVALFAHSTPHTPDRR